MPTLERNVAVQHQRSGQVSARCSQHTQGLVCCSIFRAGPRPGSQCSEGCSLPISAGAWRCETWTRGAYGKRGSSPASQPQRQASLQSCRPPLGQGNGTWWSSRQSADASGCRGESRAGAASRAGRSTQVLQDRAAADGYVAIQQLIAMIDWDDDSRLLS